MELIADLRKKFKNNQFEFSKHAADRMILRHITLDELKEVVLAGMVIEDYPQDKYGPSCLVFGFTAEERPVHVQCSYPIRSLVKIITVYEPDPAEWINYRERKN